MNMKIALIQMEVVHNKAENIAHAKELIDRACDQSCDFVILPEMFCCPYSNDYFREYGEPENGPAQQMLQEASQEHGVYIVGGSLPELEGDRVYNTCYVYDRQGRKIARHRKAHLFDIDVEGGQRFFESETLTAGDNITVFDTEFGKMGLCICFDFRSQELAKVMGDRGAQVIFVPGAFNMTTGPAHWELLFRQRAVDNQLFTVGVSPARNEEDVYVSYANSIVADPWGTVLTRLDCEEEIGYADIDLERIASIRRQLPIINARRTDLYGTLKLD